MTTRKLRNFNELPFEKKVAILELKRELEEYHPDPELSAFKSWTSKQRKKTKKHVQKILELRKSQNKS